MSNDIHPDLLKIIYSELGQAALNTFVEFFTFTTFEEQLKGAKDLLSITVGEKRTKYLLRNYLTKEESE